MSAAQRIRSTVPTRAAWIASTILLLLMLATIFAATVRAEDRGGDVGVATLPSTPR